MTIRMIDYYVKGLSFDVRQKIFTALEEVNTSKIRKLLEKNEGYPAYKSMGFTEDEIKSMLRKSVVKFENVNAIMIENGRPPLFENPEDTYESALRYVEIMRRYRQSENDSEYPSLTDFGKKREWVDALIEKMGCSWEDYIPKCYP